MSSTSNEFQHTFFENNPSFTATNYVVAFTRPLTSLGLDYFTFDRHYLDGGRIVLTNHVKWIRFYWESGLFKHAIFENAPSQFSNGHVFWNWLRRDPIYSAAALHGIDCGVTITKKYNRHSDFFHFGAVNNASINNEFIINNIECLYKFSSIFECEMRSLILAAEKERIFAYPADKTKTSTEELNFNAGRSTFEDDLRDLVGKRAASRIYLGEEFGHRHLTRGELILLDELVAGASCWETSRKLAISDAAINKHVKSIKEKLGCKTLCQVGFVAGRLDGSLGHAFGSQ